METKRGKKNSYILDSCPSCQQERWVRKGRLGTICRDCRLELLRTSRGHNWKGGETLQGGYTMIYMPSHPYAHKSGYIKKSHLVAEEMLGRYLLPTEDVHHKNRIKDDDNPENLEVKTHGEHTAETNRIQNKAQHMGEYRW